VAAGWTEPGEQLLGAGRATWAEIGERHALVPAERVELVAAAVAVGRFVPAIPVPARRGAEPTREDALRLIVGGWLEALGPVTPSGLAARLGLPPGAIAIGLAQLEREGMALRGRFTADAAEEEWCERRLLARIHRLTLGRLRREIEPVPAADLMRFLFRWQHMHAG